MVVVLDAVMRVEWPKLSHAYGPAGDIPELLGRATTESLGGHVPESTWFQLWSALCHQGEAYPASYAAVPALIEIAELPAYSGRYDPLLLAASIEVARFEGRGPVLGRDIEVSYTAAIRLGHELASRAIRQPLGLDSKKAFEGCMAAFKSSPQLAKSIWD